MPHNRSAAKKHRQSLLRRHRNRYFKTRIKTVLTQVAMAVEAGEADKAQMLYKDASSIIHRAARKGIIHRNKAARTKSQLVRQIKSLSNSA